MADPQKPKKEVKVSKATIDSMRTMGMAKAISKANSGSASQEFITGAKRMYGNRVHPGDMLKDGRPMAPKSSPSVTKSLPAKASPKAVSATKAAYDKNQARIKKMPKQFKKNEQAL